MAHSALRIISYDLASKVDSRGNSFVQPIQKRHVIRPECASPQYEAMAVILACDFACIVYPIGVADSGAGRFNLGEDITWLALRLSRPAHEQAQCHQAAKDAQLLRGSTAPA